MPSVNAPLLDVSGNKAKDFQLEEAVFGAEVKPHLVHEAVHIAKHSDQKVEVGPIVSSDLFYNPNEGQYERWSKRGVLAVEMEAAALFTVAAIRGVESACLLTVSDIVVEGVFTRITDDELKAAVDRMTRLALDVAVSEK